MLSRRIVPTFFPKPYLEKYVTNKNFNSLNNINVTEVSKNKKILCKFFINQKCNKGDNCQFSHNLKNFTDAEINDTLTKYFESLIDYKKK